MTVGLQKTPTSPAILVGTLERYLPPHPIIAMIPPAVAVYVLIPSVIALGINCGGNTNCADGGGAIARFAKSQADWVPEKALFAPGKKIMCLRGISTNYAPAPGICLFTQTSDSHFKNETLTNGEVRPLVTGKLIKDKVLQLQAHNCKVCGSVPLGNSNDPDEAGILTSDYVSDMSECPPYNINDSYTWCPPAFNTTNSLNPYAVNTTSEAPSKGNSSSPIVNETSSATGNHASSEAPKETGMIIVAT